MKALFALCALSLGATFYLRTEEQELCVAESPAPDGELLLEARLRDPPPPGVILYVFVRATLRRNKGAVDSFTLREQQGRFIYHHRGKGEVFFCLQSFAELFVALRVERQPAAPEGLITAGDLHSLERELYAAALSLADSTAAGGRFVAGAEAALRRNAAADRRLAALSLAEALLLAAVCAAQYLTLSRLVAAGARPKPAGR